jgi:hypothetical protein
MSGSSIKASSFTAAPGILGNDLSNEAIFLALAIDLPFKLLTANHLPLNTD